MSQTVTQPQFGMVDNRLAIISGDASEAEIEQILIYATTPLTGTRLIHSNNLFFQIQKDNPLQWTNATI